MEELLQFGIAPMW